MLGAEGVCVNKNCILCAFPLSGGKRLRRMPAFPWFRQGNKHVCNY